MQRAESKGFARFLLGIDTGGRDMGLASGRNSFLLKSQLALEAIFPGVMTLDGEPFAVARSGDERRERWEEGGSEEDISVTVRARKEFIPAGGLIKEVRADLDGRDMRVVGCLLEPGDVAWSVELEVA
jgi:hypothetical protein